jgi:hypothetical protein
VQPDGRVSSFGIACPYILLVYTLFAIVIIVVCLGAALVAACGLCSAVVFLHLASCQQAAIELAVYTRRPRTTYRFETGRQETIHAGRCILSGLTL